MIADTTFLIDFFQERESGQRGPASAFFTRHRNHPFRTTIISLTELAVAFEDPTEAWDWFGQWKIYPLHTGIAQRAASIERSLRATGNRLGENDNWIAAFAAYYQEPLISHDAAFDRAPDVRRVVYRR